VTVDDDPTLSPSPIHRYRVDVEGGSWWQLAWLPEVGSFEAVHLTVDRREMEQILVWHGADPGEVASVDQLRGLVNVLIPGHIASALAMDQASSVHGPTEERSLVEREEAVLVERARLASWEARLRARDADQRWTLPAAPATATLREFLGDPAFSTSDIHEFARGFGLDASLTEQLVTGRLATLDVAQVGQLCEALRCSPYDMWGPDLARSILHAYGPERWPASIEPLNERAPTVEHDFMRRRLEARAAEMAEPMIAIGRALTAADSTDESADVRQSRVVEATCFERTGVLALDVDGTVRIIDDPTRAPEPSVEYHFVFRQLGPPTTVDLDVAASELRDGPPPGVDVAPTLASAAAQLRSGPGPMADTELVRFVEPETGAEQWLGWDGDADAWETWDDPRRYYPGNPADVLDTGDGQTVDDFRLEIPEPPTQAEDLPCGCVLFDTGPGFDL
jgi:hypothetical protein